MFGELKDYSMATHSRVSTTLKKPACLNLNLTFVTCGKTSLTPTTEKHIYLTSNGLMPNQNVLPALIHIFK
jgi:hypothetical protein